MAQSKTLDSFAELAEEWAQLDKQSKNNMGPFQNRSKLVNKVSRRNKSRSRGPAKWQKIAESKKVQVDYSKSEFRPDVELKLALSQAKDEAQRNFITQGA